MEETAIQRKFELMPKDRYNEILHSLRGFEVPMRNAQDKELMWIKQGNMLHHLELLQEAMFHNSSILFNKQQGFLTYDDELIASRADDVESKTLSDRKAGKEGPVVDCVTNAQTSVMHAMKLRLKGVSELDRLKLIISQLPLNEVNASSTGSNVEFFSILVMDN